MIKAETPVLNRYTDVNRAYTPATYTYPAHQSFFCGLLPEVSEPIPYYNRFVKQLLVLQDVGDGLVESETDRNTFIIGRDADNIVTGLAKAGYYTVGSAGANWFVKKSLRVGFQDFHYKSHAKALDQIELILNSIRRNAKNKRFFAFINFMETHTPYMHYGEDEYFMTARNKMSWPPKYDSKDDSYAKKLHLAQIAAIEYLDTCLSKLLESVPENTIVILLGDHGEAFGENGYWGHGVYHPKVMEVPMSIFSLADRL